MVFIMSASPVCLLLGGSLPRPTASHLPTCDVEVQFRDRARTADDFAHCTGLVPAELGDKGKRSSAVSEAVAAAPADVKGSP
jgi:hypothetical protein